MRAIHVALDAGITFFDTADIYGTGHSERILGQALAGRRDQVLVVTKFGLTFDEYSGNMTGRDASPEYIQRACEASLLADPAVNTTLPDYVAKYGAHIEGIGYTPETMAHVYSQAICITPTTFLDAPTG